MLDGAGPMRQFNWWLAAAVFLALMSYLVAYHGSVRELPLPVVIASPCVLLGLLVFYGIPSVRAFREGIREAQNCGPKK